MSFWAWPRWPGSRPRLRPPVQADDAERLGRFVGLGPPADRAARRRAGRRPDRRDPEAGRASQRRRRPVRLRLSNVFGTAPLRLSAVHVARARIARLAAASTIRSPTGRSPSPAPDGVTRSRRGRLPVRPRRPGRRAARRPGRRPSAMTPRPISRPSMRLRTPPPGPWPATMSPRRPARKQGLHPLAADLPAWTSARGSGAAVVALGDSITDGGWSPTDGNDRWPDVLAARLQADPRTAHLGVLSCPASAAIACCWTAGGPALWPRFNRDVLAQAAVRYLIVLEGVNDLGTLTRDGPARRRRCCCSGASDHRRLRPDHLPRSSSRACASMARRSAVAAGRNYHPDAQNEADRQAVNAWIARPVISTA